MNTKTAPRRCCEETVAASHCRGFVGLLCCLVLVGPIVSGGETSPSAAQASLRSADLARANPLLLSWPGAYDGVPPFDAIKVGHLAPALEAAMAEQLAGVDVIVRNPEPATFENTLAALERSARTFERVRNIYWVFSGTMKTPEFQAVEREMAPKLAAFDDKIIQNEKLFARIAAIHDSRETSCQTAEQRRLAWFHFTRFVRAGAKLDAPAKKQLAELNQRLATLYTTFTQNLLGDEEQHMVILADEAELSGLPASSRSAMAAAAEAHGQKGKWVVLNTRSSVEPFLTHSDRRTLREQVWRMFTTRGDHGDARDNKAAVAEILELRAARAKLLGHATYAHWRMEDSMAKTPERAMSFMHAIWPAAMARVREEVRDMQTIADREGGNVRIEPWDYRYYAEKVRRAKYDFDEDEVKSYLQLEKMRDAMFWVAGQLYDLRFTPAVGVAVYHADVRVWEVRRGTGDLVGLWYFDPYARAGKESGAWMSVYRNQERFDREVRTLVSNNLNCIKGAPETPVLVSWGEAKTLFHEFGHALHGLLSDVSYPSLSGTSVVPDYVEFPSQIMEYWLDTPEVLQRFALHVDTGKPMPAALVAKLERASKFNQGFLTVEYLAGALVDMMVHLGGQRPADVAALERESLATLAMPREIIMRHRLPQFAHIFGGDWYSAGYYSYLWAETLSADAFEAFKEGTGPYDPDVAKRLRVILSAGNTIEPAEAYRSFRGRDADIGALLRRRGFPATNAASTRTAASN